MKKLFLFITLSFSLLRLLKTNSGYYYDKGDFEKAKMGYEELLLSIPQNMQYF
jgi:hypothetical protein